MPRRHVSVLALLLIASLALAALACDENGEAPVATPTVDQPQPTATGEAPPATATAGPPPFEGGRDPVEAPGGMEPPTPLLADVRAAAHENFDRVVFEFQGNLPGYRVEYVDEAIACGSGMLVEVAGSALLQVRMQPAAAHNDEGTPTFAAQRLTPGLPSIVEVVSTCDFEAEVTWVVGLTEEVDFNTITLLDPFRVVVDVAHPDS